MSFRCHSKIDLQCLHLCEYCILNCTGASDVHGGHPFIVEAAVSIGGKGVKEVGFSIDLLQPSPTRASQILP